jgi:hypothetical protein
MRRYIDVAGGKDQAKILAEQRFNPKILLPNQQANPQF